MRLKIIILFLGLNFTKTIFSQDTLYEGRKVKIFPFYYPENNFIDYTITSFPFIQIQEIIVPPSVADGEYISYQLNRFKEKVFSANFIIKNGIVHGKFKAVILDMYHVDTIYGEYNNGKKNGIWRKINQYSKKKNNISIVQYINDTFHGKSFRFIGKDTAEKCYFNKGRVSGKFYLNGISGYVDLEKNNAEFNCILYPGVAHYKITNGIITHLNYTIGKIKFDFGIRNQLNALFDFSASFLMHTNYDLKLGGNCVTALQLAQNDLRYTHYDMYSFAGDYLNIEKRLIRMPVVPFIYRLFDYKLTILSNNKTIASCNGSMQNLDYNLLKFDVRKSTFLSLDTLTSKSLDSFIVTVKKLYGSDTVKQVFLCRGYSIYFLRMEIHNKHTIKEKQQAIAGLIGEGISVHKSFKISTYRIKNTQFKLHKLWFKNDTLLNFKVNDSVVKIEYYQHKNILYEKWIYRKEIDTFMENLYEFPFHEYYANNGMHVVQKSLFKNVIVYYKNKPYTGNFYVIFRKLKPNSKYESKKIGTHEDSSYILYLPSNLAEIVKLLHPYSSTNTGEYSFYDYFEAIYGKTKNGKITGTLSSMVNRYTYQDGELDYQNVPTGNRYIFSKPFHHQKGKFSGTLSNNPNVFYNNGAYLFQVENDSLNGNFNYLSGDNYITGSFKANQLTGKLQFYYKGNIQLEIPFDNDGKIHGFIKVHNALDATNNPVFYLKYKHGDCVDTMYEFGKNGKLSCVLTKLDSIINPIFIEYKYFPSRFIFTIKINFKAYGISYFSSESLWQNYFSPYSIFACMHNQENAEVVVYQATGNLLNPNMLFKKKVYLYENGMRAGIVDEVKINGTVFFDSSTRIYRNYIYPACSTFYYRNGNVFKKVNIKNDTFCAANIITYYPNGKLKSGGIIKLSVADITCEFFNFLFKEQYDYEYYYDSNGNNSLNMGLSEVKEYFETGMIREIGYLKFGKKDSIFREFDRDGKLVGAGKYSNGKKEGRWLKGDLSGIGSLDRFCFDSNNTEVIQRLTNTVNFEELIYLNDVLISFKSYTTKLIGN